MSSTTQSQTGLDDFDGDSFRRDYRIPPLQDPLPLIPSRRPPPLEPTASVIDNSSLNATAKLGQRTRAKAVQGALPIGEDGSSSPPRAGEKGDTSQASTKAVEKGEDTSRKKQKVDYFHLPEPRTKPKPNKTPPFKPVPVLNELHEPPPSAGLFPPITPSMLQEAGQPSITIFALHPGKEPFEDTSNGGELNADDDALASLAGNSVNEKEFKTKGKRICLRVRLKWTDEETEELMKGVAIYGVGKWKRILVHPYLSFHPDRTMVDLKDRYRTCRMNEEKAIERHAADKQSRKAKSNNRKESSRIELPDILGPEHPKNLHSVPTPIAPPPSKQRHAYAAVPEKEKECSFEITTPNIYCKEQHPSSRKGKKVPATKPWSDEEDINLSKGYQKYGFQWTAITKDSEFGLASRTGAQVRDRFRLKFPIIYQSSVPLPLPEPEKRPSRPKPKRCSSGARKEAAKKPSWAVAVDPNWIVHEPRPLMKDKAGRMTYRMFDPTKESRPLPQPQPPSPPSLSQSSKSNVSGPLPSSGLSSSLSDLPLVTGLEKLPQRWSGIETQPLPDPDPEHEFPIGSTPPESLSTCSPRSRQISIDADADEARQPMVGSNIFDLLNVNDEEDDDEEEGGKAEDEDDADGKEDEDGQQNLSRLPPFKYAFDDEWAHHGGRDDVTLPPLLWEDLANRPIFELE